MSKVKSIEIERQMMLGEIERLLPTNHLFSEETIKSVIAELIQSQAHGEQGLLTLGDVNLFFTESRAHHVFWCDPDQVESGQSRWKTYSYHRRQFEKEVTEVELPARAFYPC